MAFADSFHVTFMHRKELEIVLGTHIPGSIVTDSMWLFDIFTKAARTTRKRLTIDLQTVRDTNKAFGVNDVGLVKPEHSISDALTNLKTQSILWETIFRGKINPPFKQ